MNQVDLIPHLFRTEYSKITAVLCKVFGIAHIEIAEDIASEAFLAALQTWTYNGIPENPTAWLYLVAKNKAKNHIARRQLLSGKIANEIRSASDGTTAAIDLSEKNITDSQLQMLFTICHPTIPAEAQVGLALRILCGFGIDEIASAFLTNKETINKRLFRARERLRQEKVPIELPPDAEIDKRLDAVLTTLYLLFSEGYYSESQDSVLREDLCWEAMRLMQLLVENPQTNLPTVNALMALMCFHSSRFKARMNSEGGIVLYQDQDEALWNQGLITKGAEFLQKASQGDRISQYHVEAHIAYWHTVKADTPQKWENILQLYNQLLVIHYSPIAALNRTYALSKVKGKQEAIVQAEQLDLSGNHFYFALLGELYKGVDNQKAKENFVRASELAKSNAEKQAMERQAKIL